MKHPNYGKTIDYQVVGISCLSKLEKDALRLRGQGVAYEEIKEKLFPDLSKQAVWDLIRRAERKIWRLQAKERYANNPGDCPIEELPLPARVRNALIRAGYTRIGQLAGMKMFQLSGINKTTYPSKGMPRGIKQSGALQVYELLEEWNLRKPGSYCPKCGAALTKKINGKKVPLACSNCGSTTEVKNVSAPRERELVAAAG